MGHWNVGEDNPNYGSKVKYKSKICIRCGQEFIPTNGGGQIYCKKCKPIRRKETNDKHNKCYYLSHKNKILERKKNYRSTIAGKTTLKKAVNKRRHLLDSIPLNESFEDSVAHHIDRTYVIHIPKQVHQSVSHSVIQNRNMDMINAIAFNYL